MLHVGTGKGLGHTVRTFKSSTQSNTEASALIARMTVQPSSGRATLIDNLIGSLKSAGVWTKLDCLYVMAAHDAQAARLNWKGTSFTLSAINAPSFTTDKGYVSDGSTSYLSTGYAQNSLQQDNHHLGFWADGGSANSSAQAEMGGNMVVLRTFSGSAAGIRSAATSDAAGVVVATGLGHTAFSRSVSTSFSSQRNGGTVTNSSQTSSALTSELIYILARNNGAGAASAFSIRQCGAAHFGIAMSSAETASLYSALNTYMTTIGAS